MIFKSRLNVALNPDVKLHARTQAVEFAARGGGTVDVMTGPIDAEVGVVPVRVALPFMPGRRVVLASFGPFRFAMKPIKLSIHSGDLQVSGKIGGEEGIDARVELQGKCRAEIEAAGETDMKMLKAAFEGTFEE
jgi:hypothetical protein